MVQIENQEGVKNMKEIAAVDGIGNGQLPPLADSVLMCLDVLFIGPYDLSISLGYPTPNPDPHPDVEKIIQQVLTTAHGAGKKWSGDFLLIHAREKLILGFPSSAIYCISGQQSIKRAVEGFDMVRLDFYMRKLN